MLKKTKNYFELLRIAAILGIRSGRYPLEDFYHTQWNKDHTVLYLWTGEKLLAKEASDVGWFETIPQIMPDFKFVQVVRKDTVIV